jgi:hypothetical protein
MRIPSPWSAPAAATETASRSETRPAGDVEALDEGVLLRLSRRDVMPPDAGSIDPFKDRVGGVFGPIAANNRIGPAAPVDDRVQLTRYAASGDRRVHHQRQGIPAYSQPPERGSDAHRLSDLRQSPGSTVDCSASIKTRQRRFHGRRVPMARFRPPRRRTLSFSSR